MPARPDHATTPENPDSPRPERTGPAGVVLAGGRSSRLHGSAPSPVPDKPLLRGPEGRLLDLCLAAVTGLGADPRHVVVVGPPTVDPPEGFPRVREDPPFSGPAQAVRAGLLALDAVDHRPQGGASPAPRAAPAWVVLLAADMPRAASGLRALLSARDAAVRNRTRATVPAQAPATATTPDGWIAVADGHRQPLLCLLDREAASRAFALDAAGASMRSRLNGLHLEEVRVPAEATADVDTWEDALALGFGAGHGVKAEAPASASPGEDRS